MSRQISNVEVASDTFDSWRIKTNQMANAFGDTVTLIRNSTGEATTGNGFVVGILGANTLATTELRGDFSGYQSIFSSDHWLEVMGYKPQHLFDREKIRNAK